MLIKNKIFRILTKFYWVPDFLYWKHFSNDSKYHKFQESYTNIYTYKHVTLIPYKMWLLFNNYWGSFYPNL